MGVKLAHAMGAQVVAFTTSPASAKTARDWAPMRWWYRATSDEMKAHTGSFDFILNTVAASHYDWMRTLALLKRDGTLALVGVPENPHPAPTSATWCSSAGRLPAR